MKTPITDKLAKLYTEWPLDYVATTKVWDLARRFERDRAALMEALEAAYEYIMSEAEKRDYEPPVPSVLVADMTAALSAARANFPDEN